MKVAANSRITEPAFTWSMKKMRAVCVVTVVATPHIVPMIQALTLQMK